MRVLRQYFDHAGLVTEENAWEHVYRCLLWFNTGAGLAHIYDSNHMQRGGSFHSRAVRFTELLCKHWQITRKELPARIDILFKGCVEELKRRDAEAEAQDTEEGENEGVDSELESELLNAIQNELRTEGMGDKRAKAVADKVERMSRYFYTIGNKRKNALGEGLEDLLMILLETVSHVPAERMALRRPVSKLPGFLKSPPPQQGERRKREPRPDIAIVDSNVTHLITTAKWSMRQDRETQFQSEYSSFQMNKVQSTELRYALITNEFDLARLRNVLVAMPGGTGGYIFHAVYHICLPILRQTHGDGFKEIEPWVGTGKLKSLSEYFVEMRARYGTP
jgi:hypothetical protein